MQVLQRKVAHENKEKNVIIAADAATAIQLTQAITLKQNNEYLMQEMCFSSLSLVSSSRFFTGIVRSFLFIIWCTMNKFQLIDSF